MGLVKSQAIEEDERGWHSQETFVCAECVEDSFLKELIADHAEHTTCDYCGEKSDENIAAPFDTVMDVIANTVFAYYAEPGAAGTPYDGGYIIEPMSTDEMLRGLPLECQETFFDDVVSSFVDDGWIEASDGHWSESSLFDALSGSWTRFVHLVKHQHRYFFSKVADGAEDEPNEVSLNKILGRIGDMVKELELFRNLGTEEALYRVRFHPSSDAWVADKQTMGAPPADLTTAGRMNPAGIPYLYLAFDRETAIAEVVGRPPARIVVAQFKLTAPSKVIDLTNLPEFPSIFDETKRSELQTLAFLREFVTDISRPISRDGREHIDYVPSQVISEFFSTSGPQATGFAGACGIAYPSAIRKNGKNLVLFPDRSAWKDEFPNVDFGEAEVLVLPTWDAVFRAVGGDSNALPRRS